MRDTRRERIETWQAEREAADQNRPDPLERIADELSRIRFYLGALLLIAVVVLLAVIVGLSNGS